MFVIPFAVKLIYNVVENLLLRLGRRYPLRFLVQLLFYSSLVILRFSNESHHDLFFWARHYFFRLIIEIFCVNSIRNLNLRLGTEALVLLRLVLLCFGCQICAEICIKSVAWPWPCKSLKRFSSFRIELVYGVQFFSCLQVKCVQFGVVNTTWVQKLIVDLLSGQFRWPLLFRIGIMVNILGGYSLVDKLRLNWKLPRLNFFVLVCDRRLRRYSQRWIQNTQTVVPHLIVVEHLGLASLRNRLGEKSLARGSGLVGLNIASCQVHTNFVESDRLV